MTAMWWSLFITYVVLATIVVSPFILASRSDRRRRAMPVRVVELPINIGQATAWRRRGR